MDAIDIGVIIFTLICIPVILYWNVDTIFNFLDELYERINK